jgi:hypothetical protein
MKNFQLAFMALMLTACTALTISSCQDESDEVLGGKANQNLDWRSNQNSLVFPPTSQPYGNSYAEWGSEWWKWAFGFDCANLPISDPDGSNQDQNQSGPVYFLAGNTGGAVVRDVTIPAGKAVFFPLINIINDYPCPDPNFQPAEGQSLEDFLTDGATGFIDLADILSVNVDGTDLTNLTDYRGTSSMFNFTGNPDLANCADPCITGTEQQAVTDGYWIMLKPLSTGSHTLHFTGGISMYNWVVDVTYNITVE